MMKELISMPDPAVISLIGVVLAVKCEIVLQLLDKARVRIGFGYSLRSLLFLTILFAPLLFASWQGLMVIEIIGKIVCYVLLLFVGFLLGNLMS